MTISRTTFLAAGLVIALGLSRHAAWADNDDASHEEAGNKTCFWLSQIYDFRGLDTRHVWVKGAGNDDQYLLTLFSSCTSLPFAETIALSTKPTQRLCSNANEHLTLIDQGVENQRCMITTVEKVESLDAARKLAASREEERKSKADASK